MKKPNLMQDLSARLFAIAVLVLTCISAARADYNSTVLADNPVGYWPLDLSVDTTSSATDISGNGNNGTYNNISSLANKVPGPSVYITNGVSFDGSTSYVDLGTGANPSVLDFAGQITMEVWVQPANSQLTSPADVLAKGWLDGGDYNEQFVSVVSGNKFYGGAGGGNYVVGSATTNWTHVVSTYDGTNWNLYLNGQLIGTHADTVGATTYDTTWAIGNGTSGGAEYGGRHFAGNVSRVAIYTNGLTPQQVATHYYMGEYGAVNFKPFIAAEPQPLIVYTNMPAQFSVTVVSAASLSYQWWKGNSQLNGQTNASLSISSAQPADQGSYSVVITNIYGAVTSSVANLTVLSTTLPISAYETMVLNDAPVGYWPLDLGVDVSGSANDYSGNGNNGTYVSISSPGNQVAGPSGYLTNAISFDGSSTYVNLGTGPNLSVLNFAGQITMEAWVQPSSLQLASPADILGKGWDSSAYYETFLNVYNNVFQGGREFGYYARSASTVTTNWTYLVSTYDGSNWNLYENGALVGTTADSSGVSLYTDAWAIGNGTQGGAGRIFNGNICQVAIYNHALSPSQVLAHYAMALYNSTNLAPVITTQPASQRVATNSLAMFTVQVIASPAPVYQWYSVIGGVTNAIAGATNASYITGPVQDSYTGNGYFVKVSNSVNTITSSMAILTAGHRVTESGLLVANQYFQNYSTAITAFSAVYPMAASLPLPDNVEYLSVFNDNADLNTRAGESIYGWFIPSVTGNYVFFVASDDAGALWLSTNSDPANAYEIAQNQAQMFCGNGGLTDWTCTNTACSEYAYHSSGEWRSDQFELNGGLSAFAYLTPNNTWSPWPGLNGDGSIPLVAGTKYYIELDHWQNVGNQGATVTYKLANQSDPITGAASLLTNSVISASVPDSVLPEPRPIIANIGVSGSKVTIHGLNGLVNAAYNILTSTNLALPLSNWTTLSSARFDSSGNFSSTNTVNSGNQSFYVIQVP